VSRSLRSRTGAVLDSLVKPSLLLISRNLPPLVGGMERLCHRMVLELEQAYSVSVAGPRGCAASLSRTSIVLESRSGPLVLYLVSAAVQSARLAWRRRPRIIVAGSGLTIVFALPLARALKARCVLYLHGLDLVVPSRLYRMVWLPLIRRADLCLTNSRNTRRIALECGIPGDRLEVLNPGTDTPPPDPAQGKHFRSCHGLEDRPLMLSVGRLTPRKGLTEFISRSLPAILDEFPEAVLLIVGGEPKDALAVPAGSKTSGIYSAAETAGVRHALRMLPACDDATLSAAYWAADVHVFPVLDIPGDVEGFGMVAIEAAAHGLETIAFRAGGVSDAVVEGSTGELVAAGDYASFSIAVAKRLATRREASDACVRAASLFSWGLFGERLRALISSAPSMQGDRSR
jgi:phosphatidyl-myo-inositol dimannoside synthase